MKQQGSSLWIGLALLVGGALWLKSRQAAAAGTPMVNVKGGTVTFPTAVPGSMAPTASQTQVTAAVWSNLTPTSGPSSGYVNFPSGSQAAASLLPWATDGAGNYYTQWSGEIYYISGVPDAYGNYPATLLGA